LGFPADLRNYGVGAQILNDLGIGKIRLVTNNPRKIAGLKGYGIEIVDRVPLLIEVNDFNTFYLATKAEKLGHMLLQTYLLALAVNWKEEPVEITNKYEHIEKMRRLADQHHLILREEARPLGAAVFASTPNTTIVHLGCDQPDQTQEKWFTDDQHPYLQSLQAILQEISTWPQVESLEFLLANGTDPLVGLQVQLDRQHHSIDKLAQVWQENLTTQIIYAFN
jgi:3,4-dihydroxy 2-butanone 4-phosphate synthase / GTP cyclohydrolase II